MQFIDFPKIDVPIQGLELVRIPKMMKIRQIYNSDKIVDIAGTVRSELETKLSCKDSVAGKRICITAGSRGIPHLDVIVRTCCDVFKEWGAKPFIIPAMGSHGGATAEGQLEVLEGYNITEASMGVPILSSMEVVQIGELPDGTPTYCDKYAAESDGILVLNKVKPHTDFRGKHESGLAKMMAIGMGKHVGASQFHMKGFSTFAERIPMVCDLFLEKLPIVGGLGIVQNAYDDISVIEAADGKDILDLDARLLVIAKQSLANFKINHIDVLIVDKIGKNISGNGADPNITGRGNSKGFEDILDLKKLFIRGLTEETHHNGAGIGLADVTTRRCVRDIDFNAYWTNCITATMLNGAHIPMYRENDYDALMVAIRTCNNIDFQNPRIVRIPDTLHMEEIEVSEGFREECEANPEIEILSEPYDIRFDDEGFMI